MTRHRSEEERREQILRAAFHEFCNRGYAGTTVDHIAARARLAKGTVYFYYESKAAVFDALVEQELAGPIPPLYASALLARPLLVILLGRALHDDASTDLVLKLWPEPVESP
jgi:AcrR family transcriptional regulator